MIQFTQSPSLSFVLLLTLACPGITRAAELTLVAPNGGQRIVAGSTYRITWTSQGAIDRLLLEYSPDNGSNWQTIDPNVPNTGSHEWTVPRLNSNQCLVRVTDADNLAVSDTSNWTFTIYVCPLVFDLDGDCIVGFSDFALLASEWLLDGDSALFFNYTIQATGTQIVETYPDQAFNWTVTTDATETWTEHDSNSLQVSCQGYNITCTHYLYPADSNYVIHSWHYAQSSSHLGGRENGTYIDTTNNRLVIETHSGGDQNRWCCGGYIFGNCMGWCTDYYNGYWRATYYVDARKTVTGTVTTTQSGQGTVNAAEGNKFIADFSLDAPVPQHGGTVAIDAYSIETDNPNVTATIVIGETGQVYATTAYSQDVNQPWSAAESGAAVIFPGAGPCYITTCTLIAPNGDTAYTVTDDNPAVNTWMVGPALNAEAP